MLMDTQGKVWKFLYSCQLKKDESNVCFRLPIYKDQLSPLFYDLTHNQLVKTTEKIPQACKA